MQFLGFGAKNQEVVELSREKSQSRPTWSFRAVWWSLQSGKVSSKLERWHVWPLPQALLILFRKDQSFEVNKLVVYYQACFCGPVTLNEPVGITGRIMPRNYPITVRYIA